MRFISRVKMNVFVVGLNPVNVFGFEKNDAPVRFNNESVEKTRLLFDVFQQGGDLSLFRLVLPLIGEFFPSVFHRFLETRLVERLEQVIERVNLESANRVLLVGGNKNDDRQIFNAQVSIIVKPSISGI